MRRKSLRTTEVRLSGPLRRQLARWWISLLAEGRPDENRFDAVLFTSIKTCLQLSNSRSRNAVRELVFVKSSVRKTANSIQKWSSVNHQHRVYLFTQNITRISPNDNETRVARLIKNSDGSPTIHSSVRAVKSLNKISFIIYTNY